MKPTQLPPAHFKVQRAMIPAVLLVTLVPGSLCVAGVTYTVGSGGEDFAKIQDAIDAATHEDEIVVSPGLYQENVNIRGKDIVLRFTDPDYPEVVASTTVDGGLRHD